MEGKDIDGPGSGSQGRIFSGLIVINILLTFGALSDPVPIHTVGSLLKWLPVKFFLTLDMLVMVMS